MRLIPVNKTSPEFFKTSDLQMPSQGVDPRRALLFHKETPIRESPEMHDPTHTCIPVPVPRAHEIVVDSDGVNVPYTATPNGLFNQGHQGTTADRHCGEGLFQEPSPIISLSFWSKVFPSTRLWHPPVNPSCFFADRLEEGFRFNAYRVSPHLRSKWWWNGLWRSSLPHSHDLSRLPARPLFPFNYREEIRLRTEVLLHFHHPYFAHTIFLLFQERLIVEK